MGVLGAATLYEVIVGSMDICGKSIPSQADSKREAGAHLVCLKTSQGACDWSGVRREKCEGKLEKG